MLSNPLMNPVIAPPISMVDGRFLSLIFPLIFNIAKTMSATATMHVIMCFGAMENPYAPRADKGTAVSRNQQVCFHSISFHPIIERDALLSSWAIVLIGTATSIPKKYVITGSRIIPPPNPTALDRNPANKPTMISMMYIIFLHSDYNNLSLIGHYILFIK